ncbi:hypothetical protein FYK55_14545 [Roseiconus nitratireducens]|uniref:Uncharacterized protein n=1 Tax=Roseiconus nitratireducens TaxID=2605748 RepID=A0A5M6D5E5_9BACT|nr:hypothetical protein [Roseiconus nitratireducens]KAA5542737.1 hypothetical protein FYK55_14545 [Roseiconus nitratireducens]
MSVQALGERVLEVEYTNRKQHTAFMTGQIKCEDGGAGEIMAELCDADGQRKFDLTAGAHQHSDARVACNTLTMPIPPRWSVKCYRIETKPGINTRWAEID